MAQGVAGGCISGVLNVSRRAGCVLARKVDIRLPGKRNSDSHGTRPVHQIISTIKWIRTRRLSIKNALSVLAGFTGASMSSRRDHMVLPQPSIPLPRPSILLPSRLFSIFCLSRAIYPPPLSIPSGLFPLCCLFRAIYPPSAVFSSSSEPCILPRLYQGFVPSRLLPVFCTRVFDRCTTLFPGPKP